MKWKTLVFVITLLGLTLLAEPLQAQAVESYQVNYYNVGAAQPLQQTDNFPATSALCNQVPPTVAPGTPVNPRRIIWDDLLNSTPTAPKVCSFLIPVAGVLPSLPAPGNYEGSLTAINSAGRAESTRVPFSRLAGPVAPTGTKFIP